MLNRNFKSQWFQLMGKKALALKQYKDCTTAWEKALKYSKSGQLKLFQLNMRFCKNQEKTK